MDRRKERERIGVLGVERVWGRSPTRVEEYVFFLLLFIVYNFFF